MQLAQAYGWQAERVTDPGELEGAYRRLLACEGPCLLDVAIPRDQSVFPMVAPGKGLAEVIGAIDSASEGLRILSVSDQVAPDAAVSKGSGSDLLAAGAAVPEPSAADLRGGF